MNLLDIGIIIIVSLTTIRGFFKGIIREVTAIFGVIASFFLASMYYKDLSSFLSRFTPDHKTMVAILCFILIFVLSIFLFHFLAMITRGAIRLALLGWLDRVLGGVFGLIKGVIITFFLITGLMLFYPDSSPILQGSSLFPPVLSLTEKMTILIPSKVKEDFSKRKRQLEEYWGGKKEKIEKMKKPKTDDKRL